MTRLVVRFAVALAVSVGTGVVAVAQVSPEEHAKHHPGAAAPPGGPAAGPAAAMPANAGGGMGGMMEMMGGPPAPELFPELMNAPALDAAGRAKLGAAGDERVREGTAIISDGLDRLAGAAEVEDWAGMRAALARVREGTARMESGVAARRAAAGEADPPAVATDWFKREMNLAPTPHAGHGPFGLSWFHFVVMVALVGFAAAMVGMYYRKMHRAADLLQALTGGGGVAPTPPPTAAASSPIPPRPPAATAEPQPAPATGRWAGRLRVTRVFQETPDVKTFRLMNPLGGVLPFTFLPGQFLTVAAPADGRPVNTADGRVVVPGGDIGRGQNVWQAMGGMEVGSVWGHGSTTPGYSGTGTSPTPSPRGPRATPQSYGNSPPSSSGPPGRRPPTGPGPTSPTRATGRTSRWSLTARPATPSSGPG